MCHIELVFRQLLPFDNRMETNILHFICLITKKRTSCRALSISWFCRRFRRLALSTGMPLRPDSSRYLVGRFGSTWALCIRDSCVLNSADSSAEREELQRATGRLKAEWDRLTSIMQLLLNE